MSSDVYPAAGERRADRSRKPPTEGRVRRLRFTRDMYHEMAKAGILRQDRRYQLLDGIIFVMPAMSHPHWLALNSLNALLIKRLPDGWCSTCQSPVVTDEFGEPEPDLAILRGALRDYSVKPTAADTAIVIEVSDTTAGFDRRRKLVAYAEAGIPEYWLINLVDRAVEVRTDPRPRDGNTAGAYASLRT
ncbi:MAG: Uma2 family endonuclease, partial [Planctomycetota bacterium]|nr:Uma2 family endonuclease [Planctomycetota bacterium]